jgi:putative oxidoreductase
MLSPEAQKDLGLLILRVGVGLSFIAHGWPKLIGGPERWAKLGSALRHLGVDFAPEVFGFLAMAAELGGGACLVLGLLFRPATAMMAFTMLVASIKHVAEGDGFGRASHAIELCVVFVALLLIGPGAYRVRLNPFNRP